MHLITINGKKYIAEAVSKLNAMSFGDAIREMSDLLATADGHDPPLLSTNHPYISLQFLTAFNTLEKQVALRDVINAFLPYVNENVGLDWLPLYIAYTFARGKQYLFKDYVAFFTDIDALLPGLLTNVNEAMKPSYNKYKSLIKSLSEECGRWYVYNGTNLPPSNEWTISLYQYHVDDDRRKNVQVQVLSLLKSFRNIL